jgi:hypothetical protein
MLRNLQRNKSVQAVLHMPSNPDDNSIHIVIYPFSERGERIGVAGIHVLPDTIHTNSLHGRVSNVDLRHFLRDCQYECEKSYSGPFFLSYRLR